MVFHDATPDPERITESLRDTGYSLETAVADIVDNSISADASSVWIELELNPLGQVRFSVTDDGAGMDSTGLVNALTYGSSKRNDPSSLGKFGLGLKTASTAFARKLKVTSRIEGADEAITAVWDLDAVQKHGWKVEELDLPDSSDASRLDAFCPRSGTVVRWEKVDRLLKADFTASPETLKAQRALDRIETGLREHLGMVFQRFLDVEDARERNVSISLRGTQVSAWNPFAFGSELVTRELPIAVSPDKTAMMSVRAFVLPPSATLKSELGDEAEAYAKIGNRRQGIYVYREGRLINGPSWLNVWSQEPHFSLCRVELSFGHELDLAFQVDIKKSAIVLDPNVLAVVEELLVPPRRQANFNYRNQSRKTATGAAPLHGPSNATIGESAADIPAASLADVDKKAGQATIVNSHGAVTVAYVDSSDNRVFLESVEDLPHGLLYMPSYIGTNPGVQLNRSHPFYERVYLPSRTTGTTIQALDSLLWALASAEFRSTQDSAKRMFEDLRFDLSRALARLVEELPELDESDR